MLKPDDACDSSYYSLKVEYCVESLPRNSARRLFHVPPLLHSKTRICGSALIKLRFQLCARHGTCIGLLPFSNIIIINVVIIDHHKIHIRYPVAGEYTHPTYLMDGVFPQQTRRVSRSYIYCGVWIFGASGKSITACVADQDNWFEPSRLLGRAVFDWRGWGGVQRVWSISCSKAVVRTSLWTTIIRFYHHRREI